jgi:hypothetical protein
MAALRVTRRTRQRRGESATWGIFAQTVGFASRIILLGGSNVARGLPTIVDIARRTVGGPAEFLMAMGPGRSYGQRSRVLCLGLPGITQCGLWNALERQAHRPTFALVSDIGNDVAYGAPVDQIAAWVETCVERVRGAGAQTVVTALPMDSLRSLSPRRFSLARSILFPSARFTLEEALERAGDLDARIRALAERHGARLVEHDRAWYGLDPIHIRRRCIAGAWSRVVSGWGDGGPAPAAIRPSLRRWTTLCRMTPQRWWLFGRERGRPQPAGRLPDGSTISMY